ncbi:retron Eco8 family effector endonuclease [uncultured Shewanella sp.]|uniref:retron Eco8 family effector endonuclease n=1 Tax=uncultured Shewanella sp. TaxID=173975 RepID=UPI00260965A6|nr:retron Eco8 family effector endonuclease [uncultured Shewanella sp.]
MSIKSIRICNVLSFNNIYVTKLEDVNCIIGKNNVGKSNLLKCIKYFYEKLDGKKVLPLELNSKYSSSGYIEIIYDTTRIGKIVRRKRATKSGYLTHIWKTLFSDETNGNSLSEREEVSTLSLTLTIKSDDSVSWSTKNDKKKELIRTLYPFFCIETRHIDLYNWDLLWNLVSGIKPIGTKVVKREDVVNYLNEKISIGNDSYKKHVELIQSITDAKGYSPKEKFLNYIKVGIEGQTFHHNGESITLQSDGTNSHQFIYLFLKLLISLSRTSYIHPIVYIDEPETGLHPKKNEDLLTDIFDVYNDYKNTSGEWEVGKYSTPYPRIILATHSPNILKQSIRLFDCNQQVLHFSKGDNGKTVIKKMNSQYDDPRFLNVFSDNEARLFFSSFIFFVEGSTELELFRSKALIKIFDFLRDVDVYPMNHLTLRYVNPSYSNVAIPYLVLFDADVLLGVDFVNNKFVVNSKTIDLFNIAENTSNSYFGSKEYRQNKESLRIIEYLRGKELLLSKNRLKIMNVDMPSIIRSINKGVLNPNNTHIANTTIEECLISSDSLIIFEKWLIKKFDKLVFLKDCNIVERYEAVKNKNTDVLFSALCCNVSGLTPSTTIESKIFRKVKKIKLLEFERKLRSLDIIGEERATLYRILFCGKGETLISRDNENFLKFVPADYKEQLKFIRQKDLAWASSLMGKTSGWVSDFLEFSINKYCRNPDGSYSKSLFLIYFNELSGIINLLRSDRGGRL